MAYDTVANIVSDAAVECGLDAPVDVYGSEDAAVVQLRTHLKSLGRRLVKHWMWSHLLQEHDFTTDGSASYALPADFESMAAGPEDVSYTLLRGVLILEDTTDTGNDYSFEYRSTYWVALTGTTTGTKADPTDNPDVLLFDRNLLVAGLKLAFLGAKGFDTTTVLQDYREALDAACSSDSLPRTLYLNTTCEAALDCATIPEDGFGS